MFTTFLLALVLPCPGFVLAYPLSTVAAETYIPLTIISIFLLLVLVAIKAVYMKYRRIGTIHAPHGARMPASSNHSSSTSTLGLRDKPGNRFRGLVVGFLGSPTWETSLMPRLDGVSWPRGQRRASSFAYQRHTGSTGPTRFAFTRTKFKESSSSSRFTKSTVTTGSCTDASQSVPPLSSGHPWVPGPSRSLDSVRQNGSIRCRPCCGDFGESRGVTVGGGSLPKGARRVSPSSVRLVDGPGQSSQVEYSFLSGLPPDAIVLSPLMSARDSFQLSRCSLRCHRKPVSPLPPLSLFAPFRLSKALESHSPIGSGSLPPLRFSPLVNVANVFHPQRPVLERRAPTSRTPVADGSKSMLGSRTPCAALRSTLPTPGHAERTEPAAIQDDIPSLHPVEDAGNESRHKKSKSYMGLAIQGSFPQGILTSDGGAAENDEQHCHGNVNSEEPRERWLEQNPIAPPVPLVWTPSTCTGYFMSPRTPVSDVDIGMLGLDRFHWSDKLDEFNVQSRKGSVTVVPHWD